MMDLFLEERMWYMNYEGIKKINELGSLRTKIRDVEFKNPVLVASGTFGYGEEVSEFYDISLLGGIITKTVTLNEREGNVPPRIWETPSGMLNSIGLANVGLERFIKEKIPFLEKIDTNIIVNIAGFTIEEFKILVKELDKIEFIKGFEVNVSCPNVEKGGVHFGVDPEMVFKITGTLRDLTDKLLIIKLSPNVDVVNIIGRRAQEAGADALTLINTVYGMAIDVYRKRPVFKNKVAGLSGPAIKPIGIYKVYQMYEYVTIPIIGVGGIYDVFSALEYFMAGAKLIQIGSANFLDVYTPLKIIKGIDKFLKGSNETLEKIVGVAHI